MSTRCTTRSCARSWSFTRRADDSRGSAGRRAGACRLSGARVPRRGAHRLPLRRQRRALFPRSQSACRAAIRSTRTCRFSPRRTASLHRADRHDPRRRLRALRIGAASDTERQRRTRLMAGSSQAASSPSCMPRRKAVPTRSTLWSRRTPWPMRSASSVRHRDRRRRSRPRSFRCFEAPRSASRIQSGRCGARRRQACAGHPVDARCGRAALYRRPFRALGSRRCPRSRPS